MSYLKGRLTAAILLALSAAALSMAGNAAPSRAAAATPVTTSPNSFMPGLPWVDKSGHLIQGHDGSIIKDDANSMYYWIGQDLTNGGRVAAACYESSDLVHWKNDGDILSVAPDNSTPAPPGGGLPPPPQETGKTITYMIGSTQVMYDAVTDQYLVWAGVSVKGRDPDPRPSGDFLLAVAETPAGDTPCSQNYTWVRGPFQPFGQPAGDLGLFNYTSKGVTYSYLIDADQGELSCTGGTNCWDPQQNNPGSPDTSKPCDMSSGCLTGPELRVFLMTPPNATPEPPSSGHGPDTSFEGTVLDEYGWFEAPAMFQAGGTYFLLASHKTDWRPNANEYNYTTSPPPTSGPFSPTAWGGWQTSALKGSDNGWRDVVPASNPSPTAPYTCDSQTFFVLPVQGTGTGAQATYIYMGDRWDSSNIGKGTLGNSSYVWLPLQVTTSTLALDCTIDNWSLNFSTGKWTPLSDPTFTFTNVGNNQLIDGKSDGSLSQDQLQGTSPTMNQQWKIINVPGVTTGSLYAPWYEILNAATGGDMVTLCGQWVNSECSNFLNPLEQSTAPIASADGYDWLWQFGSVNGGPSLTLAFIDNGNLVDAQPDGTLFQDPSANPSAGSQQWALKCVTNCG